MAWLMLSSSNRIKHILLLLEILVIFGTVTGRAVDEVCGEDEFQCTEGQVCISKLERCDGGGDCPDNSDELNCTSCAKGLYWCEGYQICLPQTYICNGYVNCRYPYSDEVNCTSCKYGSFLCDDGVCIPPFRRCDGMINCKGGNDEANCYVPTTPTTATTSTISTSTAATGEPEEICGRNLFKCQNGKECIHDLNRCDGTPDCSDGSDELNCTSCTSRNSYLCGGKCLSARMVCNGIAECDDGSDEAHCYPLTTYTTTSVSTLITNSSLMNKTLPECADSDVRCNNGNCLKIRHKCNGEDECGDASDELDCSESCRENQFRCVFGGRCISHHWVCDRKRDCVDGSDEANCTPCRLDDFFCGNGQCFPPSKRCDGKVECSNGQDEADCSDSTTTDLPKETCGANQFKCLDGIECIDARFRCNGIIGCNDQSDEMNCTSCTGSSFLCEGKCIRSEKSCDGTFINDTICRSDQFQCKEEKQCIPLHGVCNGNMDCEDGSDEADCPNCAAHQFKCQNGLECIDSLFRCNGIVNCDDRSDELNCTSCIGFGLHCGEKCVGPVHICNGIEDCEDGSDEAHCESSTTSSTTTLRTTTATVSVDNTSLPLCEDDQFRCIDGGRCIPRVKYCNHFKDCEDGSDEANCRFCYSNSFYCGGYCVNSSQVCDGKEDCDNGSDEANCDPSTTSTMSTTTIATDNSHAGNSSLTSRTSCLEEEEFTCTSGECISKLMKCDVVEDCADGSDEMNCDKNTSDGLVPPGCVAPYKQVADKCILFSSQNLTWSEARKFCRYFLGHLITFDSLPQLIRTLRALKDTEAEFPMWVGLSGSVEVVQKDELDFPWHWVIIQSVPQISSLFGISSALHCGYLESASVALISHTDSCSTKLLRPLCETPTVKTSSSLAPALETTQVSPLMGSSP